jgi:hypothetical protein
MGKDSENIVPRVEYDRFPRYKIDLVFACDGESQTTEVEVCSVEYLFSME